GGAATDPLPDPPNRTSRTSRRSTSGGRPVPTPAPSGTPPADATHAGTLAAGGPSTEPAGPDGAAGSRAAAMTDQPDAGSAASAGAAVGGAATGGRPRSSRLRLARRTVDKAWHDRVLGLSAEAAFWQLLS